MPEKHVYEFGDFHLDTQQKILLRAGERIPLHPKTFATLLALVESGSVVISKDDLMAKVWPDTFVEESSLTKNIALLRKALRNGHDHSDYIETIPTVGYRFVAPVRTGDTANGRAGDAAKVEDELPLPIADRSTSDHHLTPTPQPKRNWWRLATILFVLCVAGVLVVWKISSSRSAAPQIVKDEFAPIQLTHHFAEDLQPTLSPDGKRIAFASNRDGQSAIFLMKADGSGVQKLNNGLSRSDAPQWSKDGTKIYFVGSDGIKYGAYVMNADGSQVTCIMDHQRSLSFSPDGQKVVFAKAVDEKDENSIELFVANADGTHPIRLTNNSVLESDPAWSPDGKRIAFTRFVPEGAARNAEIFTINIDGSQLTQVTNNPAEDNAPNWSPDGLRLVFTSRRESHAGGASLFVVNTDGTNATRLTEEASPMGGAVWSPDGKKILYTASNTGNWEIYAVNADPNHTTNLSNNLAEDEYPAWSPDGKKLAFISNRDGKESLYVMNADGSEQHKIIGNAVGLISWLPDSQQISFAADGSGNFDIYVANADGGNLRQLTREPTNEHHPMWSPDGKRIAYVMTEAELTQIYIMNADGSNVKKLSSSQEHEWMQAWSPDSKKLVFTRSRNRSVQRDLWMMNADGSHPTLIAAAPGQDEFYSPSFAPDGQRIVFHRLAIPSHLVELWMINVDGGGLTQLTFAGGGWPAWSPDGRRIAFMSRRRTGNTEIYVMDVK